jgi:hypothetical protein
MDIPKNIRHRNRKYELIKEYPSFILYRDIETGVRETFHRCELGMIEEAIRTYTGYHTKYRTAYYKKNRW